MSEQAYWSDEVSELLGIGSSTLRKWCLALEQQGYNIVRGRNNSRAFVDKDIIVLRRMKDLIQEKSVTLEIAANIVVASIEPNDRTTSVPDEEREHSSLPTVNIEVRMLEQILEFQRGQEEFNRALVQKLEEQNILFREQIIERERKAEERERLFLASIQELQETKKLIETTNKEQANQQIKQMKEELEEQLKEHVEDIKEGQSKRDYLLQEQLQELLETKKAIALAENRKKNGFFSRLFKK